MRLPLILCTLVLTLGCTRVGGKYRWVNRRTVSDIQCHATNEPEHLSITVLNYQSLPLPGASVKLASAVQPNALVENTNSRGEVAFAVRPADWGLIVSLEGFNTHQQHIEIQSTQMCTVHIYLGDEPEQQFQ